MIAGIGIPKLAAMLVESPVRTLLIELAEVAACPEAWTDLLARENVRVASGYLESGGCLWYELWYTRIMEGRVYYNMFYEPTTGELVVIFYSPQGLRWLGGIDRFGRGAKYGTTVDPFTLTIQGVVECKGRVQGKFWYGTPNIEVIFQDTIHPTVSITSPSTTDTFTTPTITVSGMASDNRELDRIEVRVNQGAWQKATGTISWSTSITLREGENTIEARAFDKAGLISGIVSVTVNYAPKPIIKPISITVSPATAEVGANATQLFTATVEPAGADQNVTWSVDNPAIGTIDAAGLFTALAPGTVTVTATSVVDAKITGTATATVKEPPPIQGDINRDGRVDVADLAQIAAHLNTADTSSDINADGLVDIYDLVLAGLNFGKSSSLWD